MEKDKEVEKEQHFVIRYCVRRGLSATDTLNEMKDAYGDECLCRAAIFRWHKKFKDGRKSAEVLPKSGRPLTSLEERMRTCIRFNGQYFEKEREKPEESDDSGNEDETS